MTPTSTRATTRRSSRPSRSRWTSVILTMADGRAPRLLVRRGEAPFEGMWAIPGGFKRPDETLDEAATAGARRGDRRRRSEAAHPVRRVRRPGRDPRMNVVTVAYLAVLRDVGDVAAGTDAAAAALVPVSDVLEREARPRVRPRADRPRRDRARPRRARGHGHRDRVRRARRSPWPSCAPCTRPSGACSSTPRTSGAASSPRTAG